MMTFQFSNNTTLRYFLSALLVCCSVSVIPSYATASFTDVSWHKYQQSIEFLRSRGVVKGYPDGSFGPDRPINRSELMKIILEASLWSGTTSWGSGASLGSWQNCFTDVAQERFAPYVCYAKKHSIVRWYPDGTYKPYQNVTIAEGFKITLESFQFPIQEAIGDARYQPYFDFIHNNTIFSKYSLRPDVAMTRGQMAYLAHQLMLHAQWNIVFTGIRKVQSPGCGITPPSSAPSSSVVNGETRHYITAVGSKYDKNTPTKLIFAFHGRTNPNTMVRNYYRIERESQGNAIIVYPSGLPEEGPSRNRSNWGDKPSQLRDFALFDQVLEEFSNTYCINTDQVFVVGHSLGARFTNSLACARWDVIRAIGSVGWWTTINTCSWPVAAMIMHNPEDNLADFRSWVTALQQLLAQNSCGQTTVPVGPEGGNCLEYTDCQAWAPVIWCPHSDSVEGRDWAYYPHTRPDFAWHEIWEFFDAQK